ncbi:MAG: MATE family efflux transporter [Gammaproteobacteria bacterium]|nr:MATE family efflux transporter [Gammaproteobacteria bacterium]
MIHRSTLRELSRLAFPMVVSQGAFAVMIFTDRLFMSYLDATHIAAALGGGVGSFFFLSFFTGLITYGNALVAQYYGSGKTTKCARVTTQGLLISTASVPVLLLGAYYGGAAFSVMGHAPEQVALETVYFQVLMTGSVFILVKATFASYFAGIGQTRVVMVADLLGTAINVPLTWALVFGNLGLPALGIAGAGLGTVMGTVCSILVFLAFYFSKLHRARFSVARSWQFDAGIMRRYFRLGLPSGVESFMNTATFNLFLLLFQSYGVVQGAAMAIVFNWDMLSFIPMIGLNIAVMSMVGRCVGANDMQRAIEVIKAGFMLALFYSGVLAIGFLIYREPLVAVFDNGGEDFSQILALGSQMMVGLVTYMLADAVILISGGALRGAGDTRWIMLTSISVHWIMLIVQYLVIVVYQLGPMVSWWVFVAMLLSLAVLYLWRLLGGKWAGAERLAKVMSE